MGAPDAAHAGLAYPRRPCHGARRPVGGVGRFLMQRHLHHLLHLPVGDAARAARPRCVFLKGSDPAGEEAVTQTRRLLRRDAHPLGNLLVLQAFGGQQHDPRPLHHARRQRTSSCHPLQGLSLFRVQFNCRGGAHTVPSSTVWTHSEHNRYYLRRTTLGL